MQSQTVKYDWAAGECAHYAYHGTPTMLPRDTLKPYVRSGQSVVVLQAFTVPDDTHDEDVLPMFLVRFPDGYECELWADEMM